VRGQLGTKDTEDRNAPTLVVGVSGPDVSVSAGNAHACFRNATPVGCWGSNQYGQLGIGTTGGNVLAFEMPVVYFPKRVVDTLGNLL